MASPEKQKGSMTPSSDDGGSGDAATVVASVAPMMNGTKQTSHSKLQDGNNETSDPTLGGDSEEGGGSNNLTEDKSSDDDDGSRPTSDNFQPEEGEGASSEHIILEKSPTNPERTSEGSIGQLTVIDGPLADMGKPEDGGSIGGEGTAASSQHTPSHTPNSSMGSSLGELLGESAALMEHGLENGTMEQSEHIHSPSGSVMDLVSTEKPNIAHHVSSKSTSDMEAPAAAATTTTGEKPPLKYTASSPPDNAASGRPRSPQRPVASNRERANSSQDNTADLAKNDNDEEYDDDDDDDDENDIPPHIQSKIVEKSPAERYIRFKEKLGSGAYKDVYRAYDTIEGIEVAWNVVKLSGVPKAERVRIVNEVRLLERLHHPNIISFHGSWVNRETERVIFVTEILSSGTLKSFVQKVQLIRWKIFKRWAIQILKGLEYLHSQDPPIIHRDLKCDNIFINGTSGDLRIGDFGLSTAINKKNQPLSVLGTPEFMAPELYDENYNEKVDIYAFGMLLLEIITRDVPYHECANPAQIYKKVTLGIPPASLRRVKSEDARKFILVCLGTGEDANERPSASDLLKHEFLTKKSDDEATIEVELAVEDMPIAEKGSMTFSDNGSEKSVGSKHDQMNKNSKYASSIDGHEIPSRGAGAGSPTDYQAGKPPRSEAVALRSNTSKSLESKNTSQDRLDRMAEDGQTDDDDDGDHFGNMQEKEANMKKVTVLMGRGTTLDDDEEPPAKALPKAAAIARSGSEAETSSLGSSAQYKVSAVPGEGVIEGQAGANIKPYPNDAINLALTLPDESQTTIEFEFDLVNDDPVQVAREMVTELDEIPDDKVLDISGAISGVARQARMKQNQWTKIQQQAQQHQQNALAQQQALQQHQQAQQQHQMAMHPQGSTMQPPQGNIMMPQQHMYGSGFQGSGFPPTGSFQNPGGSMVQQPQLGTPGGDPSASVMGGPASTGSQSQIQQQPPPSPAPSQMSTPQPPSQMSTPQMSNPQPPQQHNHISQQPPPPPATSHMSTPQPPPAQMSTPQPPQQHQMHAMPRQSVSVPSSPAPPMPQATSQQQLYPPAPQQKPTMVRSQSMEISSSSSRADQADAAQMSAQQLVPLQQPHLPPPGMSNSTQDMIAPRQLSMPLHSQQPQMSAESASESEPDTEELRNLEQEFSKKMQRAQKSYGTRMDNLHRSKEEAEAQHLMTLEKHERERIEFEKRVRLAEEEQTRRLNKIQEEFIEKKKEVRQHCATQPPAGVAGTQMQQQNGHHMDGGSSCSSVNSRPPLHGGHKRSSSHFDSSMSALTILPSPQQLHQQGASPMVSDHTRSKSDGVGSQDYLPDVSSQTLLENPQQQQQIQQQPPRSHPPNIQAPGGGGGTSAITRDRSGSTSS